MIPKNFNTYGYGSKGAIPDGSLRLDWADGPDFLNTAQPDPFTKRWAAFEAPGGGIRLVTASPSVVISNTSGLDSILVSSGTYKQISLGFDQNGYPVLAVENSAGGTVTLHRWVVGVPTAVSWPGITPRVLFNGLPFAVEYTGSTDVICFYLKPAGDAIYARAQRDNFAIEYVALVLSGLSLERLTKVECIGRRHYLWGMTHATSRALTDQVSFRSRVYGPWSQKLDEDARQSVTARSGVYFNAVVFAPAQTDAGRSVLEVLGGVYFDAVVADTSTDAGLSNEEILSGDYVEVMIVVDIPTELGANETGLSDAAVRSGAYVEIMVPVTPPGDGGTAAISALSGVYA